MVWETLAMLSCTGKALVWRYCTTPKIAPMAQMRMPRYIRAEPLMPPKPSNLTLERSGILMSASPAKPAVADIKPTAIKINLQHQDLFNSIRWAQYCKTNQPFANHFLARVPVAK